MKHATCSRSSPSACRRWGGIFDVDGLRHEVDRLTNLSIREGFWDQREQAEKLMRERARAEETVQTWDRLTSDVQGLGELLEMTEGDESELTELVAQIPDLEKGVRQLELQRMLQPDDDQDAILSVNAGAGGTDAQDWAEMLLRMYQRWSEKHGYKVETQDLQKTEVGIASASILVRGPNAYGFLRAENGVHRLIRVSRFSGRRETSFVAVSVVPDLDDDVQVDMKDTDLEISVMRSGGAGGQHVNRTESAVRIVHKPTGFTVRSDSERSQHQNRELAMQRLRGLLYEKARREQEAAFEEAFMSDQGEIAFGSQARTYTLHPYKMVKDERTELKVGNAEAVLDGDLDELMESYLLMTSDKRREKKLADGKKS